MFKYLRFSNFKISIDFNPYTWSWKKEYFPQTKEDPNLRIWYLRILPLSFLLVIDNGEFVRHDYEVENVVDTIRTEGSIYD
jgi:hypothetical protein